MYKIVLYHYLHGVDCNSECGIIPSHFGIGSRFILLSTTPRSADAYHSQADHQQEEPSADHDDNSYSVACKVGSRWAFRKRRLKLQHSTTWDWCSIVNKGVIGKVEVKCVLLAPLARWPGPWRVPPMLVPMYKSVIGPEWTSTWWRSILAWAGDAVLVWWSTICCGRGAPVDGPLAALIWAAAVEWAEMDETVEVEAASATGTDAWGWSTATCNQKKLWGSDF